MKRPRLRAHWLAAAALSLVQIVPVTPAPADDSSLEWLDFEDAVFARAGREGRLVLLDLGAVWCHWCHVMEETTYKDPAVVALLRRHFLLVRVDQDARPDLSNRYEDYGWPATILFDAKGTELVKLSGYIPPLRFASFLRAVVEDPTPGPSALVVEPARLAVGAAAAEADSLAPSLRDDLESLLVARYDEKEKGWGFAKKYLDWDAVEYSLLRARGGDAGAERRAKETLAAARRLIDPVWGGIYQYSHGGNWDNPHFEKLVSFQAEVLRAYALAYAQWRDPADLRAAREIERYLTSFLRGAEGGFFVSQDADLTAGEHAAAYFALDDAGRRRLGLPRVDTHVYARETAWAASALLALHEATGDARELRAAEESARFLLAERARGDGGFVHEARGEAHAYLGDTLMAARLFLGLHAATGERAWLGHAEAALRFIAARFRRPGTAGFVTAAPGDATAPPLPQREENALLVRVASQAFARTGELAYRTLALQAMGYLTLPEVARRSSTATVLLAEHALAVAAPTPQAPS